MSRSTGLKLILFLLALCAATIIWGIVYELVVAARFNPSLAGEGAHRFDLILSQSAQKSFKSLLIPFQHFYARVIYPPTRTETFLRGGIAAGITVALGLAFWTLTILTRKPMPYGNAKFGTIMDASYAGLTRKGGLILGKLGGTILRSDDPAHVLVVGPTRSGKGVSFVIPNGYFWNGSAVWFDPKRENYALFGARRKELGDQVFLFSPGDRNTHRYNPVDFIRRDGRMATDCLVVSSFLIADDGKDIWGKSARLLLSAMIGYVVASATAEGNRTIKSVSDLTTKGVDFNKVLKLVVATEQALLPKWVVDGFNQFIALEPETRNSALFNVTVALNPWNSDLIAGATETTDFDIRYLRKKRMSIFIGASIAELEIYRPLVKLLIQQIHDQLMQNIPGADEPHQVLLMIDEFRQLGRMDDLVSKLTINAGYGFRMCLILQDVGQLDELYGRSTRITTMSACQVKLFIRINDTETSDYVSEMLGDTTVEVTTANTRGNQKMFQARDKNTQYIQRPLRTAEALRKMDGRTAIALVPNASGFELRKILYYNERPFKRIFERLANVKLDMPVLQLKAETKQIDAAVPQNLESKVEFTTANAPPPLGAPVADMAEGALVQLAQTPQEQATIQPEANEVANLKKPKPATGFKSNTSVDDGKVADSYKISDLKKAAIIMSNEAATPVHDMAAAPQPIVGITETYVDLASEMEKFEQEARM
jgi:type IV secretion system protein VirD4